MVASFVHRYSMVVRLVCGSLSFFTFTWLSGGYIALPLFKKFFSLLEQPLKLWMVIFVQLAELINYTQPVYVWREDPNSRQNTIKEIKRRVASGDEWQQILIFPEGTCTNRSGLITFKPGAFYPGVPVQPVCIRYPNRLDTVSWTWQGPGA